MDLVTDGFEDYELLDSGNGRKLERFGKILVARPAPQAIWPENTGAPWSRAAAVFHRKEGGTGDWKFPHGAIPDHWSLRWKKLTMEIRLTGFGNVGIFPEHICHWDWMVEKIRRKPGARVLNLFAYTGGASMVCAEAGAAVTHIDAAKSVNNWAAANAGCSRIPERGIRFLTDDAVKFVKREIRRRERYDGIIVDPPTFGRGVKGEVWKIERDFFALLELCREIMTSAPLFLLVTSHSPGITPQVLRVMLGCCSGTVECGEMLIREKYRSLPAGVYARWT